jgi:hypothetical protein
VVLGVLNLLAHLRRNLGTVLGVLNLLLLAHLRRNLGTVLLIGHLLPAEEEAVLLPRPPHPVVEVRGLVVSTGVTQRTTHKSQQSTGLYVTLKPACRLVDNVTGKTSPVASATLVSAQVRTLLQLLTFLASAISKRAWQLFVDLPGQYRWLVDLLKAKKPQSLKLWLPPKQWVDSGTSKENLTPSAPLPVEHAVLVTILLDVA